jgi:xylulokinase
MMPSTDAPYILAIDLGTSGPKVAIVSRQGAILADAFEPVPLQLLPGDGAEQSPVDWWAAIVAATRRLLAQGVAHADAIAAICCTGQWSGTVAVDQNGRALMNAVIWMDSRGARYIKRTIGGLVTFAGYSPGKLATWLRLTGGVPGQAGKDSIAHILFIKHERPDIYRSTYKFLEPKDYLNLRLTGRFAATYDSITLHWVTDNRRIDRVVYDGRLLALAGIERSKLPDLCRATDLLGPIRPEVAAELGLSPHSQVIAGTPDIQSAAIGSGAVPDYAAQLYIGTSSWLVCHVPFKKTDLLHNMASLPSPVTGRYLLTNEQETAGACLTFLRDRLLFPDDALGSCPAPPDVYTRFDRLAADAPAGSGGLIFTPWLYGERTPVEDHTVRGAFYNLSLDTTRAQMVRAVLEGVAYNSRWLLGAVEHFAGRRFDTITIAGGGARSELWCQVHADVLGRPIRQARDPIQVNLRGAAFLALVALGQIRFADVPALVPIAATYTPDPTHRAVYDRLFRAFVDVYRRNRGIYARLNG